MLWSICSQLHDMFFFNWSQDHKHDKLLAEMNALEQKSAMLQALLVGDLHDLKKSDLELQQAVASVR